MRTAGTNKRSGLRACLLITLIGVSLLMQRPDPGWAQSTLSNGYFIGYSGDHRFEALFEEDGGLSITGPFGDYQGSWELISDHLCVDFRNGPREGRNCAPVSQEGPLSIRVGDHLFLAKLANALRLT